METLHCPLCNAVLEHHVGLVEVPALLDDYGHGVTRLEAFLACTGCEWCETVDNLLNKS